MTSLFESDAFPRSKEQLEEGAAASGVSPLSTNRC